MAAQGRSEDFHVLHDFVCEALHAPAIPLASPTNQGRNEGMSVVEELVFEAGPEVTSDGSDDPDRRRTSRSPAQDAAIKSAVEPLAAYIAASGNPREALAQAMEFLIADLNTIDRAAAAWLGRLCHAGERAGSRAAPDSPAKPSGPVN